MKKATLWPFGGLSPTRAKAPPTKALPFPGLYETPRPRTSLLTSYPLPYLVSSSLPRILFLTSYPFLYFPPKAITNRG